MGFDETVRTNERTNKQTNRVGRRRACVFLLDGASNGWLKNVTTGCARRDVVITYRGGGQPRNGTPRSRKLRLLRVAF